MPATTARRSSLCLFCAIAARPAPRRFLPLVQTAARHGGNVKSAKKKLADIASKPDFNPLKNAANALRHRRDPHHLQQVVVRRLEALRRELEHERTLKDLRLSPDQFEDEWHIFTRAVTLWMKRSSQEVASLAKDWGRGTSALEERLKYLFYAQIIGRHFTQAELQNQKDLANLRYPGEWYPATRELARTVHLHVGPTNSGKTYQALQRLEQADKGIYLGPLRLLAHEVYTRLNAKGKLCALVTGEEQRLPEASPNMWSCTVEMAPLNAKLDVAVIDEIQMINHEERGWAWTQAFLGVQAKEVHLCGEARAVPIIRELCALIGDKCEVHNYERLSPLKVADRPLDGKLELLEKGDCIVSFSVLGIHALRREIEKKTGRKCAIVYGSLPPETRAQQARLFNDPNNDYDFLVASDAIGMGLNLSIKRVIFESVTKSNGRSIVRLKISEIKQIGGRAGRYRTAHQDVNQSVAQLPEDNASSVADPVIGLDDAKPIIRDEPSREDVDQSQAQMRDSKSIDGSSKITNIDIQETNANPPAPKNQTVGLVTTLDAMDYGWLKKSMSREPEPIKTAGIFPPSLIIERFTNYFPPGTPFSYILLRLNEIAVTNSRFHLCTLKDQLKIADAIQSVKGLSVQERLTLCSSPSSCRYEEEASVLRAMAECIAENKSGELLDLPGISLEILEDPPSADRNYLWSLEKLHKTIVLYLWLSYRFENVFTTRALANHVKKLVEDKIEAVLKNFSFIKEAREAMRRKRMEALEGWDDSELEEGNADDDGMKPDDSSDVPREMKDVMHDRNIGRLEDVPRDDEGKYPTPELEALEPSMSTLHHQHRRHRHLPRVHTNADGVSTTFRKHHEHTNGI